MRPRIEALDVDAMEWAPLGPAGLYSKLLSRDTATGARTALQRLCPADGYEPPKVAHYHATYEEILGVDGCFSFDSRLWLRPGAYVFHPPKTVHGFKSGIQAESLFLSRVGRDLEFTFVPEPEKTDLYRVEDGGPDTRPPVALGDALTSRGCEGATFLGGTAKACRLSVDEASGEGSAFVRLDENWASTATTLDHYLEIFVMEGGLAVDGVPGVRHAYFFYPPASAISPLTAAADTLLYVNFGGPIGL